MNNSRIGNVLERIFTWKWFEGLLSVAISVSGMLMMSFLFVAFAGELGVLAIAASAVLIIIISTHVFNFGLLATTAIVLVGIHLMCLMIAHIYIRI
ncbi:MAG: hypothetical protein WD552_02575 [Candidatus Paceibacterota bacterium]